MPKQRSLIKITGVADGQSFFYTKNGGYQMRAINPTMSERVKTEEAFQNTRKCSTEFSVCGAMASAILRVLLDRWRFILTPKPTGTLTATIYKYLRASSSGPWGQRTLELQYLPYIQNEFNMLSKNEIPVFIRQWLHNNVVWDDVNDQVVIASQLKTTADLEQEYIAKGATGLRVNLYVLGCTTPFFSTSMGKYFPPQSKFYQIPTFPQAVDITGTQEHILAITSQTPSEIVPQNATGQIAGMLVVFLPYKKVNGVENTLQHLCSAYWKSLQDASE